MSPSASDTAEFFPPTNPPLAQAMAASAASGERLCAFPIADDYVKEIKSEVADIKQCSEQGDADHIIAARFLREFIEGDSPWLHLDLAASRCKMDWGRFPPKSPASERLGLFRCCGNWR